MDKNFEDTYRNNIIEKMTYDDNDFHSDVHISSSLSKSLSALNTYVKKNLFYDESEEPHNDSAYFSKETSPNNFVVKYDSDSGKSQESSEKRIISTPLPEADVVLNIVKVQSVGEIPFSIEIKNTEELTDDYKFKKLNGCSKKEPNEVVDKKITELPCNQEVNIHDEIQSQLKPDNIAVSLDDLTTINKTKDNNTTISENILRNKKNYVKEDPKRHTIHDTSDWINRTNVYPDVYAPLPYKSPSRRYVESDVNIHYRCPVRHDPLPLVPERELARQQAEHMKRLYREQKRNKYLQELQDMQNRRHQDNFMPSQKTVIPLNRYDEAEKLVARALYAFNGQTTRELSFKKGDLINVRRQIDSNWYEGEVHGRIGLFPYNYVEILKGDYAHSPKKPVVIEGQARAKFDFTAQTNLELPLKKGEVVVLTRRIDHNWWEGRNGIKTGIFPDSYVTVLQEPSQTNALGPQTLSMTEKPAASPAAHGLVNGAARRGLQRHSYTPQHNSPALSNAPPATAPLPGYVAKPAHSTLTPSERGYGPPPSASSDLNNAEPLYVDTNAEAVPYRAMYKYRPQNPDELELQEGDTVYVLEKCDDGWYVGSSQRTGRFGTFPGNYVERI